MPINDHVKDYLREQRNLVIGIAIFALCCHQGWVGALLQYFRSELKPVIVEPYTYTYTSIARFSPITYNVFDISLTNKLPLRGARDALFYTRTWLKRNGSEGWLEMFDLICYLIFVFCACALVGAMVLLNELRIMVKKAVEEGVRIYRELQE